MYKKIISVGLFALPLLLHAQGMKRTVVASAGISGEVNSIQIRSTVAQTPNAGTVSNTQNFLRQGFQQPPEQDCPVPPEVSFNVESSFEHCIPVFYFKALVEPSENLSFSWDFGPDAEPQTAQTAEVSHVLFSTSGSQNVRLRIKDNQCSNQLIKTVEIPENLTDCLTELDNLISPNGDGMNEFWVVPNRQNYEQLALKIYNRWGTLIYQNDNYQDEWNGINTKGDEVPEGVYFYVLEAKKSETETEVFEGSITVLR